MRVLRESELGECSKIVLHQSTAWEYYIRVHFESTPWECSINESALLKQYQKLEHEMSWARVKVRDGLELTIAIKCGTLHSKQPKHSAYHMFEVTCSNSFVGRSMSALTTYRSCTAISTSLSRASRNHTAFQLMWLGLLETVVPLNSSELQCYFSILICAVYIHHRSADG